MAVTQARGAPRKSEKLVTIRPQTSRGGEIRLSEGELYYFFCVQLHEGIENPIIFHK